MPFKYHPPTRTLCKICEELHDEDLMDPIIDAHNGKSSSANNFPFHNWYNFVLGYSPEFPEYMLQRENIEPHQVVVDPFMGSGTTLLTCKQNLISCYGVDANDFMVDAARVKLQWDADLKSFKSERDALLQEIQNVLGEYDWDIETKGVKQLSLFGGKGRCDYRPMVQKNRPKMLKEKYISDIPLAKALLIDDVIECHSCEKDLKDLFKLALTSIIVPISNIRYGPGFGVGKPRPDVDVFGLFAAKLKAMVNDLSSTTDEQRCTQTHVYLGDARRLSEQLSSDIADLIITSPPYPGDHEYTKHTRLELIFRDYASTINEFRIIKRRMLRASTTNVYKEDNDREAVKDLESIVKVTDLIEQRLEADGATSGFEKLYTKLVWEYFGGMHKALAECFKILKPNGKIVLLVSDSHAFKMVHIQTAAILKEIGQQVGFVNPEVVLWQLKSSTSHKYSLRENILILQKP